MITTTYDPAADALYVRLAPGDIAVADTREVGPGIVLGLDARGTVVGIEVSGVRDRSGAPSTASDDAGWPDLAAGYAAMAADTEREREALDWSEATIADLDAP